MLLSQLSIPLEDKLRALVAGMRYAASKCEDEADQALSRDTKHARRAVASTLRSDADAIEEILNAPR